MKLFNVENLSKKEKLIADYIMKNYNAIAYLTIEKISEDLSISIATISRFFKKTPLETFKNFKQYIIDNMNGTPASKVSYSLEQIDKNNTFQKVFAQEIKNMQNTMENMSENEFLNVINALLKANKIFVYAPGPSLGIANILKHRLNRYGFDIIIVNSSGSELFESLVNINEDDLVLMFVLSKFLVESKVILDYKKEKGYKTVVISDFLVTEMKKQTDYFLYVDRGNKGEYHSMTTTVALMDSIIIGISNEIKNQAIEKLHDLNNLRMKYYKDIKRT